MMKGLWALCGGDGKKLDISCCYFLNCFAVAVLKLIYCPNGNAKRRQHIVASVALDENTKGRIALTLIEFRQTCLCSNSIFSIRFIEVDKIIVQCLSHVCHRKL